MTTLKLIMVIGAWTFFLAGCGPTPLSPVQKPDGVNLAGYYDDESTAYYKIFSDGTENQFGGYDTINGRVYYIVLESGESSSIRFYYDSRGAEGFQNPGDPIIWYDQPFPNLPERTPFDSISTITTTYLFEGHHIKVITTFLLADTEVVGIPLGVLRGCAHFILQWKAITDSTATYGTYDDWYAKGPGEIKYSYEDESPLLMETGYVNGVLWAPYKTTQASAPIPSPATGAGAAHLLFRSLAAAHVH